MVEATRGAHGGYVLARPAAEITMDEVVLALEGHIAPMDCFVDDRDGRVLCSHTTDEQLCATKLLWTRVQMGVIRSLQRTTLAELVDFSAGKTSLPTEIPGDHGRPRDQEPARLSRRQADPQGRGSACPLGRVPRPDGPERLRQVDPRQRADGASEPRGDRGPDPLRRRGHHRGRSGRARPRRPLHGLPVPGRDPRRDRHEVPAHGHERAPRGARRGADLAEGLPQDGRGRDGADQRAEGVLHALPQRGLLGRREEAHGDPPARAARAQAGRARRDRLRPGHRRAQHGRRGRQRRRRARPAWAR